MATNKQAQAKAIYEMWDVILQHRWRFVLPTFAITALVLCGSLFLPRKYQATAHFERRNAPELTEAIRSGASESYIDPIQSLVKDIAGSNAIAEVISTLEPRLTKAGYIQDDMDLQRLRSEVKQRLLVNREYADSTRIQLRLELVLDDPNVAALIVNGLIDRYITKTRADLVDRAENSIAYFDELISDHRKQLDSLQEQLGRFEQNNAMMLPEQPYSLQTQLSDAQDQLSMLLTQLEGVDIRRKTLREAIDAEPATVPSVVQGRNPELDRLRVKMESLDDQIRQHLNIMRQTEQHPEVIALRQEQASLQAQIDATASQVITATQHETNPKRTAMELELTSANSDRQALSEQIRLRRKKIEELTAMSSDILPVRARHRQLLAEVDTAQKDVDYYQNMRRRAENYLTPESGERGVQLEFVRRAEPYRRPISPNLMQVVLVAGFLGVAAGALSVFLAHRTDESFRNARQLADSTSLPLIGSVSELITQHQRRARTIRYSVVYPINAAAMAAVLVAFAALLYLDLERPDTFKQIKERAKSVVTTADLDSAGQHTTHLQTARNGAADDRQI